MKQLRVMLLFPHRVMEAAIPLAIGGWLPGERRKETELELQVNAPLNGDQQGATESLKVGRIEFELKELF